MQTQISKPQSQEKAPESPSIDRLFEVIRLWAYLNGYKIRWYPYSTPQGVRYCFRVQDRRGPIWFGLGHPRALLLNLCRDFGIEVRP